MHDTRSNNLERRAAIERELRDRLMQDREALIARLVALEDAVL